MNVVLDASAIVASFTDRGERGEWASAQVGEDTTVVLPEHATVEVANTLRRLELAREVSSLEADLAHIDLLTSDAWHVPYWVLAARAWQLRHNLTVYDAAYVALAELLDCPLVTCDVRLAGAPGIDCEVRTPAGA